MPERRTRMSGEARRAQILEAALDLFARQGYGGTTTREIAEHAGVNEAIIFRHFPHKEDLYWETLDRNCRLAKRRRQLEARLRASDDDRAVFSTVANDILTRNAQDNRLFRLLMFSGLENHGLSGRYFRTYLARNYRLLAARIQLRVEQGVFRPVDPLLAARTFLGMTIYHFLIEDLFARKRYSAEEAKRVSEAIADIWLQGMQVREESCQESTAIAAAASDVSGVARASRRSGKAPSRRPREDAKRSRTGK